MNIPRLIRTVRYLKPIQIWNRLARKRFSLFALQYTAQGTKHKAHPHNLATPFTFLNQTATPADWNDPALPKLWLYNLHYFDYLATKDRTEGAELIARWIAENPRGWGNGWEPYPISLRVVNWIKWLQARDPAGSQSKARVEVEESLREQVAYLEPRLEYHLLANHLLANAKALVFAGAYFSKQLQSPRFVPSAHHCSHRFATPSAVDNSPTDEVLQSLRWLKKGLAIYRKELPEQVLDDGVHFERSPMYHSIILEDLLDCMRLLTQAPGDTEIDGRPLSHFAAEFRPYAEKMLSGLALLTGPDGKISLFNDSAHGIAKSPSELFAAAVSLGLTTPQSAQGTRHKAQGTPSGFLRLESPHYVLLAKTGEIGPSYQPGHAHADTYSFELWRNGEKVVTDTGTDRYVVDDERRRQRGTAAHNTVTIDGKDSSEVWAGHRVGRRFDPRTHRRTFELTDEGLRCTDEIGGRGEHTVELRWHLAPDVRTDDISLSLPSTLSVRTEPCLICEEFGRQRPSLVLIATLRTTLPTTLCWTLR